MQFQWVIEAGHARHLQDWGSGARQRASSVAPAGPGPSLSRLDADALGVLDALGVPYAAYDADGRQRLVSASAVLLMESDPQAEGVWSQARDLAVSALEDPRWGARLAHSAAMREAPPVRVPASGGRFVLQLRVVRERGGVPLALVLLQPRPYAEPEVSGETGDRLTAREIEVARLVAAGRSTKEVGASLGISVHTARHHTERVFKKLGVRSRVALALTLATPMGASSHSARASDA